MHEHMASPGPHLGGGDGAAVGVQHHKLEQCALVLVATVMGAEDAQKGFAIGVPQLRHVPVRPRTQRLRVRTDSLEIEAGVGCLSIQRRWLKQAHHILTPG